MEPEAITTAAGRYAEPDEVEDLAASVLARLAWRLRHGFKECSSCHEHKSPSEFNRNATRRDGLDHYCRLCRRRVNGSK